MPCDLRLMLRIFQKMIDLARLFSPCPTISLVAVFHIVLGLESCTDSRPVYVWDRGCLFGLSKVFSLFLTELLIVEVVSETFVL